MLINLKSLPNHYGKTLLTLAIAFASVVPVVTYSPEVSAQSAPIATPMLDMLDINTATAKELAKVMKGVGLRKAKRIVAFRQANGDFPSVDALIRVKGIGKKTVRKNRELIEVSTE